MTEISYWISQSLISREQATLSSTEEKDRRHPVLTATNLTRPLCSLIIMSTINWIASLFCFAPVEGTHKPVSLSLYFNAIYQFSENSQPACAEEIRSSLFVTVCCAGIHLQCLLELLPGVAGNLEQVRQAKFLCENRLAVYGRCTCCTCLPWLPMNNHVDGITPSSSQMRFIQNILVGSYKYLESLDVEEWW